MNIVCPECGFSRELSSERIPRHAVMATCPQCSCCFRFVPEELEQSPKDESQEETSAKAKSEEEMRPIAAEAYRRESRRFDPEAVPRHGNPWDEAPAEQGWLSAFYYTVLRAMFAAPSFFCSLNPNARLGRSISFYLIICICQSLFERFWAEMFFTALSPAAANDPKLENILQMLSPESDLLTSLLLRCGLLLLQLYIFSFLMYLAYRLLVPERARFTLVFQVMAYSSAPALLSIVPALGSLAGMVWGLFLLAIGCRCSLRLNWGQTLAGFLPIILIFAPMILQSLAMLRS